MTEILELSQYTSVEYTLDAESAYAELHELETPERCAPERITLRFEFPESFPEHPPHLYVPEELQFQNERPSLLAPSRQDEPGQWCPVSLGGLTHEWSPETHDLSWILSQFLAELTSAGSVSGEPSGESPQ